MALKGLKIVELAGLAPGPFAGMVLADFGASVISIEKVGISSVNTLTRGKRLISVNLKDKRGVTVVKRLSKTADVFLEPFRPGVTESMGLGPSVLMRENPRLIYARLTGYGQSGIHSKRAGHDLNYLAISGILSKLGRKGEPPYGPLNLVADFAGGSMMCVTGILMALIERQTSGKGQIVDCSMVEGSSYLGTFLYSSKILGLWDGPRGSNLLDSGAPFYEVYETSDGKYMSVAAIEPQFYSALLKAMGLHEEGLPHQMDFTKWEEMKIKFAATFKLKSQQEWIDVFNGLDACVEPVLTPEEAKEHPHNVDRSIFITTSPEMFEPAPAPRLSRTPAEVSSQKQVLPEQEAKDILSEAGYSQADLTVLLREGIVDGQPRLAKL